jgi:hypothetical protein
MRENAGVAGALIRHYSKRNYENIHNISFIRAFYILSLACPKDNWDSIDDEDLCWNGGWKRHYA